ncbi:MAG: HPF/RaiA family ribosome-associated protein [Phycisphaerae bacterium]
MLVQIQNPSTRLSARVREQIDRRVRFALSRFAARIRGVRVRVADLNGARGGVDKRCLLEARLTPRGRVVVEATDVDVEVAVSRAADRVARRVGDELRRRWELNRRPVGRAHEAAGRRAANPAPPAAGGCPANARANLQ